MQKAAGTQAETRRGLVVSIHDVSPLTRATTEEILRDLRATGVARVSLLVIPDHHGRVVFSEDVDFCDWLRGACSEGHEAVLHGYKHLRAERGDEGAWEKVVTRSYTAGEGEFFDLPGPEAAARLRQGLEVFARAGVETCGFIAPAWLLGAEAEEVVASAGFRYTTRIGTVTDFEKRRIDRSRSLVWSVRAGWRRVCSLVWNRLVLARETDNRLVRIGIHPPDWSHPAIRRQILQLAGAALAGRTAITYETWVKEFAP